ncbi:MAG TPA: hypothetical protein VJ787_01110, partial [Thermoleophilia bacterium]|nr:hypothetical protein [Thermoleophilia bacterium]
DFGTAGGDMAPIHHAAALKRHQRYQVELLVVLFLGRGRVLVPATRPDTTRSVDGFGGAF